MLVVTKKKLYKCECVNQPQHHGGTQNGGAHTKRKTEYGIHGIYAGNRKMSGADFRVHRAHVLNMSNRHTCIHRGWRRGSGLMRYSFVAIINRTIQ